jgi:threonine/homoserine/homoserine lactone efflux protein
MAMSELVAFWGVTFLLILAPGADWAFTLGVSLHGNSVIFAVCGLCAGYAMLTLVVAAGLGVVVASSHGALTAVGMLGGTYLGWLGIGTLRHAPTPVTEGAARTNRSTFLAGLGVSGLNPRGLLIFIALLPQFTEPGTSWPISSQVVVLGTVFTLTCAVFYLGLGTVARTVLLERPRGARIMNRVSGAGMVVIGTLLIVDRILD